MKNFIQENTQITIEATKDIRSGELVVIGSLIGVANTDVQKGQDVTLATQGVFEFACKTRFQTGDEVHVNKSGDFVIKGAETTKVGVCVESNNDKVRIRFA